MRLSGRWGRALLARAIIAFTILTAGAGSAFAASYVDNKLPDLAPEARVVVAEPKPVQFVFQFQSKGVPNAQATKYLKEQVTKLVTDSGVFSQVSETPVAGGAVLSITINNVPSEDAVNKGFVTGLTFGLKGNTVTDFYVFTADYNAADGAPKITKTLNHAIYTTVGISSAPPNGVKAKNLLDALTTSVRQMVANGVNDIAKDPGFTVTAASTPAAPVAPAAPAAPAPTPASAVETQAQPAAEGPK